jgi:hypothetical protein
VLPGEFEIKNFETSNNTKKGSLKNPKRSVKSALGSDGEYKTLNFGDQEQESNQKLSIVLVNYGTYAGVSLDKFNFLERRRQFQT